MVLLTILAGPVLIRPPPEVRAELLLRMLLVILSFPLLKMPPPPPTPLSSCDELLLTVLLVRLTVPVLKPLMPPPPAPAGTAPLAIVSPTNVTIPGLGTVTLKMRKRGVPPAVLR